jgi:hypothetical protein
LQLAGTLETTTIRSMHVPPSASFLASQLFVLR